MASFFVPISAIIKLMLRLRRGGTTSGEVEENSPSAWFGAVRSKLLSSKKRTVVVATALVVVLAVAAGWYIKANFTTQASEVTFVTDEQAAKSNLQNLKDNPVPASAPLKERVQYLDNLSGALAKSGDYRGAIAAFDRRTSMEVSDLDYYDYLDVASYYHKIGDKEGALRALDRAAALLPTADDSRIGYYHDIMVQRVNGLRAEYAK